MNGREELIGLQFLRGLCALAVVIGHCAGMLAEPKYGGLALLGGTLEAGMLGVDIFFVISGFIMAVAVLQWPGLKPRMTLGTFTRRRVIRIVPMMWLAIIGYVLLQRLFARDAVDLAPYLRGLFLIPYATVKPDIIWTLRQELVFYVLFALCFFGPKWTQWLLPLWLVSPAIFLASRGDIWGTTGYIDTFWSVLCSTVNLEFGMGLGLGVLWLRTAQKSDWCLPVHPFIVLALLVMSIVGVCFMSGLVSQSLASVAFIGATGTLVVGLGARVKCRAGWLTRLGGLLGDASYSIYLFHLHILAGLLAIRAKLHVIDNAPLAVIGIVVTATMLCTGIHLQVERPLTRWLRVKFADENRRKVAVELA